MKTVIPRQRAVEDIEAAIDHYLAEADADVALALVDEVEASFIHIARHPASGSPRWASELSLPGLRTWPLHRFPYLVFYVERADHVDVWRVLHQRQDIPTQLP